MCISCTIESKPFSLSTNNTPTPPVDSQNLTISGNLSNAAPVFTTTNQTQSDSFIGALYTLTGVNGSAKTASNTQQLKWSLVSWNGTGNVTDNFSIGETSGILSKTNNTLSAGTYVLQIKLEDTYNGTNVATPGVSSVTVAQDGQSMERGPSAKKIGKKVAFRKIASVLQVPRPVGTPACGMTP